MIPSVLPISPRRRGKSGFLLLEVVFAASIIGVSVVMVLNAFSRIRTAVNQVENYLYAGVIAEETISELSSGIYFNSKISLDAVRLSDVPRGFRRDFKSAKITDSKLADSTLVNVNVNVYWDGGNTGQSNPDFALATYLKGENK